MKNYFKEKPNQCGVFPILTGKRDPMLGACIIHDKDYNKHIATVGGVSSSSKKIDQKFWDNMGRLIEKEDKRWKRALMKVQRVFYYSAVRVYGSWFWGKKAG